MRVSTLIILDAGPELRSPLPRRICAVKSYRAPQKPYCDPMKQPLTASPSAGLSGRIRVPGDKSISHRALILGALATGTTRIAGLLEAEDVLATANAVAALGAEVERSNGKVIVQGQGVGGLRAPSAALDFGNSGTGSRLMLGVVAGHDMEVEFTGDASLRRRPMGRVLAPLAAMGLETDADEDSATLPLMVRGTGDLLPIVYYLPVPSAQVKSRPCSPTKSSPSFKRPAVPPWSSRWPRATIPNACSAISAPSFVPRNAAQVPALSPFAATPNSMAPIFPCREIRARQPL